MGTQSGTRSATTSATQHEPQTWNTFRRREEGDLCCAVPADAAVPRFLFSGEWDFGGQHSEHPEHSERETLPGFQRAIAHQSVRMNGFYLFQVLRAAA